MYHWANRYCLSNSVNCKPWERAGRFRQACFCHLSDGQILALSFFVFFELRHYGFILITSKLGSEIDFLCTSLLKTFFSSTQNNRGSNLSAGEEGKSPAWGLINGTFSCSLLTQLFFFLIIIILVPACN